ncbi:aminoacyl-tRNA hydrolase [Parablautia intestinalis]|uniref:aminoacyl-tRNA hydrolase n=1 Tax=Parablautia intestinalis TaxID=2320100 RepID=UPI0023D6FA9D|nr:aminoacyl-tRNA hydrolase [Parablautia intestinalis]MCI8614745.1 aminoacyl-tRNA hydrolase [Lachnospiraceae bacterium]MDE7046411.1 aminoacyl-tRNA hydrolase [Lachnospiraceae bacterium]
MFIIAGLGNPKKEYDNTRHNIGFEVIDALADKYNISVLDIKNKAMTGKGIIEGQKVILVKPLTYMNLSGESIRPLADYYKTDYETELIIISDDINLPPGQIRIRKKGSAGGHNGLKNIIRNLGSSDFQRIRVGVGEKPKEYDLADYVLGHFTKEEKFLMKEGVEKAVKAAEMMLKGDMDQAMNEFNRKVAIDGN